ncbi:hydroxymethylglutaryl-CoA synthase family protein [Clostridium beijerinckii]|uniref:Polyketide biosynthesis 3-hydroxy-3-methylglutaryl-CoA synthase-like enzyme PksG n=1 Tax=Clostridium beijerinckii TaxID=1520 RepID=A0AAE5LPU2_CLOBE|nr:hydroxymethylglutaryl-CoA synthase family protein [Clostridium beijerinckii]NRT86788.1 polyketide biosynthesis 3-hydroxy-3-methylglutaryl-CoA synthase-like enzyme PksG [Clostridium beijerinckii]NSB14153.1 polyketide biosynthesis 3-hydroxy-3-methylglutaryl-CoA synthase-like enzyme PksG [Clostridium beijerinckii]NYC72220.1 polyketide biosynthesis 3-hydroxy-3-methylglutaryl-CoA synthase-like enzyme PksG [Clostridium beijerinckii]OOM30505.1 polyketide biosynthesis 3-hydroxy-3-methylglutaryl-ACP 
MVSVGIEAMNVYGGTAYLDVMELAKYRNLDSARFENLLMKEKSVALPYEDPITYGVNAAKPIIDSLSQEEKDRIELVITCTESGIDFGKSISTYIREYLGLSRNCRAFEIKQACYSGTAGFQMAVNFILSQTSPGAKALVVATDISRFLVAEGGDALTEDWSFAEPSSGAGAVAILVGENPAVFQIDVGANGYYGYEVMDTCRAVPDCEAGNADLSLLSYLDCCEQAFKEYSTRVTDVDYRNTFQYLSFHTPFGGMVKGAHRTMMRKICKAKPKEIEEDFQRRVLPGMTYCQRVGNIMGATIFMSLAGTIDNGDFTKPKRIGCFSYGSGCCSEFYSGVVTAKAQEVQKKFRISQNLDERYKLTMEEYEKLLAGSGAVKFGTRNTKLDLELIPNAIKSCRGKGRLFLTEIKEFHREYEWL